MKMGWFCWLSGADIGCYITWRQWPRELSSGRESTLREPQVTHHIPGGCTLAGQALYYGDIRLSWDMQCTNYLAASPNHIGLEGWSCSALEHREPGRGEISRCYIEQPTHQEIEQWSICVPSAPPLGPLATSAACAVGKYLTLQRCDSLVAS